MSEILTPTIAERSHLSNLLIEELRKVEPGGSIPYKQLSDVCGRNVQRDGYCYLATARRVLLREHETDFATVPKVGLKRVEPNEAAGIGAHSITKMHRESKRGLKRLSVTKVGELDRMEMTKFNAVASGLGALYLMTETRAVKRLESAVDKTQAQLGLKDTLAQFGG